MMGVLSQIVISGWLFQMFFVSGLIGFTFFWLVFVFHRLFFAVFSSMFVSIRLLSFYVSFVVFRFFLVLFHSIMNDEIC